MVTDISGFLQWVAFMIGVWLLLKKFAGIEGYLTLRVVVLTALLSYMVIVFYATYGPTPGSGLAHCVVEFDDVNHY